LRLVNISPANQPNVRGRRFNDQHSHRHANVRNAPAMYEEGLSNFAIGAVKVIPEADVTR
jgi:hypothetical protein